MNWEEAENYLLQHEPVGEIYDSMDGPSEEEAYLQGGSDSTTSVVSYLLISWHIFRRV
jgi:hypothetical protein